MSAPLRLTVFGLTLIVVFLAAFFVAGLVSGGQESAGGSGSPTQSHTPTHPNAPMENHDG